MTSEEIGKLQAGPGSERIWLREIAKQLALLREHFEEQVRLQMPSLYPASAEAELNAREFIERFRAWDGNAFFKPVEELAELLRQAGIRKGEG